ncbi:dihydrofolate reductase family protein [Couchioplanes caeruleus]|uniref:Deaminase n=2 Tax=Couchioplanes caeruleus TaxID=56438 RepID=A0A1K0FI41_9ACTN|nr:dihydrofolate reductase family protein [Couchioplanes caeruleus]OJF12408.1 deaminase [Couchioplanes caeruleus subsp. caeruleus]ROP29486.1 dihydrofolate reductase [Couchioplanes caeruleus]
MAKLLYSATMSLDGYIAGPDGDMSWMTPYLGPDPLVDDLVSEVGTVLAGNRTFRGDDPYRDTPAEGQAFGGAWSGPQVVLTHHRPSVPWPGVTFAGDLPTAVALAKEAAGEKYVNVLGADVARQCLAAGVLDEILVCIAPVLLGAGTRLYDQEEGTPVKLERIRSAEVPHSSDLWFRVLR